MARCDEMCIYLFGKIKAWKAERTPKCPGRMAERQHKDRLSRFSGHDTKELLIYYSRMRRDLAEVARHEMAPVGLSFIC